ncbi:hypothetical protein EVG20_g582 [Dentipellis fragilis]|uniref:F-box domain-containing protein n=1 Tax=Dentipellis fragilis TaxID=205917 RepID=A0A4Y9ZEY9_9AGAM|nr:hypothetical protein EVG20_g582 [Dentipellis fragilis]
MDGTNNTDAFSPSLANAGTVHSNTIDVPPVLPDDAATRQAMTCILAYESYEFHDCVLRKPSYLKVPASILSTGDAPGSSALGDLDVLSKELLQMTMGYMDLQTLSAFRLVNKRGQRAVASLSPYRHILTYAPDLVYSLVRTKMAAHFTVNDLYDVFCAEFCGICNVICGAFFWIPGCMRCCHFCLRNAPELMPITESDIPAVYGLSKSHLANLPVLVTVPGKYCELAVARHGNQGLQSHFKNSGARQTYEERVLKKAIKKNVPKGPALLYMGLHDGSISGDDPTRFMATTFLPYFDRSPLAPWLLDIFCQACDQSLESDVSLEDFRAEREIRWDKHTGRFFGAFCQVSARPSQEFWATSCAELPGLVQSVTLGFHKRGAVPRLPFGTSYKDMSLPRMHGHQEG